MEGEIKGVFWRETGGKAGGRRESPITNALLASCH